MEKYGVIRFSKKTGKMDTCITSLSSALLSLWALQNTTKTKDSYLFRFADGLIVSIFSGDASGFPKVERDIGDCECCLSSDLLQSLQSCE